MRTLPAQLTLSVSLSAALALPSLSLLTGCDSGKESAADDSDPNADDSDTTDDSGTTDTDPLSCKVDG